MYPGIIIKLLKNVFQFSYSMLQPQFSAAGQGVAYWQWKMRIQKPRFGCVLVAFHFLCHYRPRELLGIDRKGHTYFPTIGWQVLGCTTGTPRIFRCALCLTQMEAKAACVIWGLKVKNNLCLPTLETHESFGIATISQLLHALWVMITLFFLNAHYVTFLLYMQNIGRQRTDWINDTNGIHFDVKWSYIKDKELSDVILTEQALIKRKDFGFIKTFVKWQRQWQLMYNIWHVRQLQS